MFIFRWGCITSNNCKYSNINKKLNLNDYDNNNNNNNIYKTTHCTRLLLTF